MESPSVPARAKSAVKAVVRREKKGHGGKCVTIVEGIPSADLGSLATEFKRSLGTGARIEGDRVVIQGDLVDRVAEFLEGKGSFRVVRGN